MLSIPQFYLLYGSNVFFKFKDAFRYAVIY